MSFVVSLLYVMLGHEFRLKIISYYFMLIFSWHNDNYIEKQCRTESSAMDVTRQLYELYLFGSPYFPVVFDLLQVLNKTRRMKLDSNTKRLLCFIFVSFFHLVTNIESFMSFNSAVIDLSQMFSLCNQNFIIK